MKRSWATLLAASLLFNIFAIGAAGGGLFMLNRQGGIRIPLPMARSPISNAGAELPAPDRRRFNQTMRALVRDNRDLARTAREHRIEAAALFVQPQFDQAAVAAALDRARDADFQLRARLETGAIGFAAALPEAEREILAQGLARGGPLRHPARVGAAAVDRP